ncbi:hypothetical protein V1512DRAFT_265617 [Lipomyces arxii]|uniref:uncharacterized protein n=1 Tax=Lipomyces arxii TaxID=56418 RepID=UPI0034CFE020
MPASDSRPSRNSVSGVSHGRALVGVSCAMCDEPLEHNFCNERVVELGCGHFSHGDCFKITLKSAVDSHVAPLGASSRRNGNKAAMPQLECPICNAIVQSDSLQLASHIPARSHAAPLAEIPPSSLIQSSGVSTPPPSLEEEPRFGSNSHFPKLGQSLRMRASNNGDNKSAAIHSKTSFSSFKAVLSARQETQDFGPVQTVMSPASLIAENENLRETVRSVANGLTSQRSHSESTTSFTSLFTPLFPPPSVAPPTPPSKRRVLDPKVSITSANPAVARSNAEQYLSCLVKIEVPHNVYSSNFLGMASKNAHKVTPQTPRSDDMASSEHVYRYLKTRLHSVERYRSLDLSLFGPLRLWGLLGVTYNGSRQNLDCYLFDNFLLCVKEKFFNADSDRNVSPSSLPSGSQLTIKSLVNLKKHLTGVDRITNTNSFDLKLNLSMPDFQSLTLTCRDDLEQERWQFGFIKRSADGSESKLYKFQNGERESSDLELSGASRSSPTRSQSDAPELMSYNIHIPVDLVLAIPDTLRDSKLSLVLEALRFIIESIGHKDRVGVVVYSFDGAWDLSRRGLQTKKQWENMLEVMAKLSMNKNYYSRADPVKGAQQSLDLLRSRIIENPISTIFLLSDASANRRSMLIPDVSSNHGSIQTFCAAASMLSVTVHCFGIGVTHDPDDLVEISSSTQGTYTYIKDWVEVSECLAGCLGLVFGLSHKDVKILIKTPEESAGRICKIEGGLMYVLRNADREAEVSLGDTAFGASREIIVQIAIPPAVKQAETAPFDQWDVMMSGLKAIGDDEDNMNFQRRRSGIRLLSFRERVESVEEVPVLKAEVSFMQFNSTNNSRRYRARPGALLVVLMLQDDSQDKPRKQSVSSTVSNPQLTQRRFELLAAETLQRAVVLVENGKIGHAGELIRRTQKILQGLAMGVLPLPPEPKSGGKQGSKGAIGGIDSTLSKALNSELQHALSKLNADNEMFLRDTKKRILQMVGITLSQRSCTTRSAIEAYFADKVKNVRTLVEIQQEWSQQQSDSAGNSQCE